MCSVSALSRPSSAVRAVELLPAIEGDAARNPILFERLRAGPSPHVLHFLGHDGGFDRERNPVIRLADDPDGERSRLPIEVFAEELRANFNTMRLIYLEACSGARPGAFASAAEQLMRSGVDAVVAHLWPVRAELARAAAQEDFYTHLIGARVGSGDIGASVQASRRTLLGSSAGGFSPVLYPRGPDSQLFDIEGRRVRPPRPVSKAAPSELPAPLRALLQGPFALVLGEAWDDEATVEVRTRLREGLLQALQTREKDEATTPLFSLAQRHALHAGRRKLDRLFQRIVQTAREARPSKPVRPQRRPIARPRSPGPRLRLPKPRRRRPRTRPTRPGLRPRRARRRTSGVVTQPGHDRQLGALQRNLLRLSYEVELTASLAQDETLAEVGVLILDDRWTPTFGADEV